MTSVTPELRQAALVELARREYERRFCKKHPAYLLERVKCVDATSGETFEFCLLSDDERKELHEKTLTRWDAPGVRDAGWLWQRELLDEWRGSLKHASLKARQLGITWLAAGLALHTALYTPGSKVLAVSIKETEAIKLLGRVWDMLHSLPEWLWCGAKVVKPTRGGRPLSTIALQFPDGRVSYIEALTSSPSAGHGDVAALVILDEFARQEYASDTWKAVLPTTQGGGRVLIISTGNGVSVDRSSGRVGGNFFHHIWLNARLMGVKSRFLPWDLHPGRDDAWYREHAEPLPAADRGEQYPRNEDEAFILTGTPYFDLDSLRTYASERVRKPAFNFDFEPLPANPRQARIRRTDGGRVSVYVPPNEEHTYAIGADPAGGSGADYSVAYVIDLQTMELCAQFRAQVSPDLFAIQLHFLGRWYGEASGCKHDALLAVENQGGWGLAVTAPLRDGTSGRPRYARLYHHELDNRPDRPTVKPYGFPMNTSTRPKTINQIERAIRERTLPFMSAELLHECRTFVHRTTNPSPAAQEGANDDCVMAACIALEMYRQKGAHPDMPRREKRERKKTAAELMLQRVA